MSRKKRFVGFGLALLLVGLLVALDIALSARTVDRLTREGIEQSFTISAEANWCAHYNMGGGASNCGFKTHHECLAAVRGVGGSCGPSPHSHHHHRH